MRKAASESGEDRSYLIDSVLDAFTVLDILCVDFQPMSINEIKDEAGFTYDKTYRILKTCATAGKVEALPDGRFRVGYDLLTLLHHFTRKEDL